jgi:hypothetical protein
MFVSVCLVIDATCAGDAFTAPDTGDTVNGFTTTVAGFTTTSGLAAFVAGSARGPTFAGLSFGTVTTFTFGGGGGAFGNGRGLPFDGVKGGAPAVSGT